MEKKKILIVDDDKVILRTVENILEREGYYVIPLSLGKEAIKVAKERLLDVIILDSMMPDMDGGDVAFELKNNPLTKNIPIIYQSSLVTKREEDSNSKKDGIYFTAKPIDRERLLRLISECVGEHDFYMVED